MGFFHCLLTEKQYKTTPKKSLRQMLKINLCFFSHIPTHSSFFHPDLPPTTFPALSMAASSFSSPSSMAGPASPCQPPWQTVTQKKTSMATGRFFSLSVGSFSSPSFMAASIFSSLPSQLLNSSMAPLTSLLVVESKEKVWMKRCTSCRCRFCIHEEQF